MALDGLALPFLSSSLTMSLVRSSDLMLESTLSSVTTFYQVPCGCQGYSFELTLHASIPRKTRSSSSWRPSCSRKETSLLYVLSVEWISFLFRLLWFCYLLPVVSLADLHDVYSEGHSCFCTQWCSPQILLLCQWVCSCCSRTRWRCSILF